METIIRNFLNDKEIGYEEKVPMSQKTWIHRGPIVPFFIYPDNKEQLKEIILFFSANGIRYKIVGHTSNLYFKPTYIIDAIISTSKLSSFYEKDGNIICNAGVNISKLSQYAVNKGYSGFEGLVGLPGTVGAAVVNNSGCFNCVVSDLVVSVNALVKEQKGTILETDLKAEDLGFQHRSTSIKRGEYDAILLEIKLKIYKADNLEELKKVALMNIEKRRITQEGKANNLGSIFSGYKPRPISLFTFGLKNLINVLIFRVRNHFCNQDSDFMHNRNRIILGLYGYKDIVTYVSPKNMNCFIWKDNNADMAFDRYIEFMHKYADCGKLEIEILQ